MGRNYTMKVIPSMQALEVRRVPTSADLEKPGDFAFIKKRAPIRQTERIPLESPKGFLARIIRRFTGARYTEKVTEARLWPSLDTVIIVCPSCLQPFGTTDRHTIVSLEPLTISPEVTCPYCRTKSFCIEKGTITRVSPLAA
jgi:hypothetical protein